MRCQSPFGLHWLVLWGQHRFTPDFYANNCASAFGDALWTLGKRATRCQRDADTFWSPARKRRSA